MSRYKHKIFRFDKPLPLWSLIIIILSSVLFVYLVLRSISVPFTHDEASTFFHYVHIKRFFPEISTEAANNHYLNTLLTYVSYYLFGGAKWALRLPNILSSIIFFYYLLLISKELSSAAMKIGFFISVALSIHFIDFFALSRGYGLSMAFLTATLYYLIISFNRADNIKAPIFTSLFLFLMLSANLTTLYPAIAVLLLHLLLLRFKKRTEKKVILLVLLLDAIFITTAIIILLQYKNEEALYLGTESIDFITMVKSWLSLFTENTSGFKLVLFFILSGFLLFSAVYNIIKHPLKYFRSSGFIFDFIFWSSLAGIVISHVLLHINYAEGRVGLYFFPLFMGSLFFSVDSFLPKKPVLIFLIPILFFPVSFITGFNFTYAQAYKNEVLPKRFYDRIAKDTLLGMPTIGGYHMESTTWQYLNYINGNRCNLIDWNNFPESEHDYQIFDTAIYPNIIRWYDIVDFEPLSHISLMKRKNKILKKQLQTIDIPATKEAVSNTYINLFNEKKDYHHSDFMFDINLSFQTKSDPLHLWLVLQILDNSGKSRIYKYTTVDALKDNWLGDNNTFRQIIISGKIPDGIQTLKLYFWNMDNCSIKINSGKIVQYELFAN